jgi:D-alanyl-lipoteichoic acid acyltransferase DltB (MBOAT superfamily)
LPNPYALLLLFNPCFFHQGRPADQAMTKKVNLLLLLILATGFPIALSLFFWEEAGLFTIILYVPLGLVFVAGIVIGIDRENYAAAKTSGLLFALIVILGLANTEYFKSPTVLEAWLKDDTSGLHLSLRENGQF